MKKATRKLVIHGETLRALAELELVRVPAGAAQLMGTDSPATGCPLQVNVLPKK
jgi:hypothetical protein